LPRITPVHWKTLECVFLKAGFVFERQRGDHRTYVKEGILRPLVIPTYREISPDIIHALMRTAGMDRAAYFNLLSKC
jgi:predicted RNA binding protein YcfA (HicA-like mRNA interferase family)